LEKYIIVARTRDRVIGQDNRMPWHLPEDLKLFKKLTTGNTVIMGRRTYQSIGKPLPNRNNIVVSRSGMDIPGAVVCQSMAQALAKAEEYGQKIFFIGGAEIYRQALPLADFLCVSWLKQDHPGDTKFPEFDESDWERLSETEYPEFTNVLYKRIR
jgi:dihydrofolate reductase